MTTDIKNKRIVGVTLYYPINRIYLESDRHPSINTTPNTNMKNSGAWRITDEAFTITLSREIQNEDKSYIILIYAIWIGTENMTFLEK